MEQLGLRQPPPPPKPRQKVRGPITDGPRKKGQTGEKAETAGIFVFALRLFTVPPK